MDDMINVLVTCPHEEEAKEIGTQLLAAKLAACVQRVPGIVSNYVWQGTVHEEQEVMLFIKTRRSLFRELSEKVSVLHSYEVPEIIALPIIECNTGYYEWLQSSLK